MVLALVESAGTVERTHSTDSAVLDYFDPGWADSVSVPEAGFEVVTAAKAATEARAAIAVVILFVAAIESQVVFAVVAEAAQWATPDFDFVGHYPNTKG